MYENFENSKFIKTLQKSQKDFKYEKLNNLCSISLIIVNDNFNKLEKNTFLIYNNYKIVTDIKNVKNGKAIKIIAKNDLDFDLLIEYIKYLMSKYKYIEICEFISKIKNINFPVLNEKNKKYFTEFIKKSNENLDKIIDLKIKEIELYKKMKKAINHKIFSFDYLTKKEDK